MGLFVKICGMARAADVDAVAELSPDAMGFILWSRSRRAVTAEAVAAWTRDLPSSILKVGVFVDESPGAVRRAVEAAGLDVVQYHGGEPPGTVNETAGRRWKALHLDRLPAGGVAAYQVDAFLVDSYGTESPGGTGKTVDWERARAFIAARETPVLLAGGLTPENVVDAVRRTRPWGVDAVSGLERRAGEKDMARVKEFIRRCRGL